MISLGIDIGGTTIKAAAIADGRPVWTGRSSAYSRPTALEVQAHLHDLLKHAPPSCTEVDQLCIGLCAPGIFDSASGTLSAALNMPGLIGVPLQRLVLDALPSPPRSVRRFLVTSDVHAAGHHFTTSRALHGRVLAISLGTGVGAVVLDDLAPLRVSGPSSGHFGQMDVTVSGIDPVPIGPDGGRGSLEAYWGVPALTKRHGDPALWLDGLRGTEPELAALARAIRIGHAIYRPSHIALLGGIGTRLAPVADRLRTMVSHQLTALSRPGWTLACGDSDYHAAEGVAALATRE